MSRSVHLVGVLLVTSLWACGGGQTAVVGPPDDDGDGWTDGMDCDDTDASVFPGADEVPYDGIDQDCSGSDLVDVDRDTWPGGPGGDDCDDRRPDVHPAGVDVCGDGIDQDCAAGDQACTREDLDGDGASPEGGDCNDHDPDVGPHAAEIPYNGRDDDCDPATPDDDLDGDGWGRFGGDCDEDNPAMHPAAAETCNGLDDDCDGRVDEDSSNAKLWYLDRDGDGFGEAFVGEACAAPPGAVAKGGDCNDSDPQVHPDATEICDGTDQDCSGVPDDDALVLGDAALCAAPSCAAVLQARGTVPDGTYHLSVGGRDVVAWCDMTSSDGGYTLVQRTVLDWADSSRLMTGWSAWRDATLGDPMPGHAYRLAGSLWPELLAGSELLLVLRVQKENGESCDPLYYLGTDAVLTVGESEARIVGMISDVTILQDELLSTAATGPSPRCVADSLGVPWWYGSCCSTCPTYKGGYWSGDPRPMVNYTAAAPDLFGRTEADVCGGDAVQVDEGAGVYRAVSSMEVFVR